MNKNKFVTTTFTRYGPIIGTLIIVISFHILIYLDHPARFLQSLITPSVVIPMCILMLITIVVGYIIGYIPAYITGELFLHIFKNKLANANLYQVIAYGCFTSFLWIPLLLIFSQFSHEWLLIFLYLQFVFILPITVICAVIEWRQLK
ncbi:hypothetical protein [Acinetobacter sp. NIPH 2100]|uniref:hypothetical protein n=1 Tax=Acinetobacter sp. NIPH 2100 TaxID=1217708 RepID=UPI0002D0B8A7|nr:hypothetical protein [Acinetobacter sp. NIPH 2100]ENX42638.1 hypothetical protein F887_00801 [Acinetobacter sp. NIPH 2100]